ncbi:hypothetical protein ACFWGT_19630 [Nocardiopsis sp. NPDC060348]
MRTVPADQAPLAAQEGGATGHRHAEGTGPPGRPHDHEEHV